jgi:hypothetical protein
LLRCSNGLGFHDVSQVPEFLRKFRQITALPLRKWSSSAIPGCFCSQITANSVIPNKK